MTSPVNTPTQPVTVTYDIGNTGKRRAKTFTDAHAAKAFYVKKDTAGKKPTLSGDTSTTVSPDAATKRKIVAKLKAEQAAKKKPATKAKPEPTVAAEPAPIDPATLTGVSMAATRPYFAGLVIARHGLAAGVTDEMIAEVDAMYKSPCPRESKFALRNAWHAARGYTENATS